MGRLRHLCLLPLFAFVLLWPLPAASFCGFYVSSTSDAQLLNEATTVILMREGTRTVLSMENNYRGPAQDFALVVPVPVVLAEDDVHVVPPEVFERLDRLSSPRLVEYWERDPCQAYAPPPEPEPDMVRDVRATESSRRSRDRARRPPVVVVEARFAVGEYSVEILSATESLGLEAWLVASGYALPPGAAELLEPYVQAGSKFFAAKVDAQRVQFDAQGRARLSPLRLHYDSEDFALPVRLGLINAKGPQDLIVHILAPGLRYETTNYDMVPIPTNVIVRANTRDSFAEFYAALFDHTLARNPGSVVLEYAWGPMAYDRTIMTAKCDPCPEGLSGLTLDDLLSLGVDVLPSYAKTLARGKIDQRLSRALAGDFTHTRLHARYAPGDRVEDLVFHATGAAYGGNPGESEYRRPQLTTHQGSRFQARYSILHHWIGPLKCEQPIRGRWDGNAPIGEHRGVRSATDLAFAERDAELADFVSQTELAGIGEHLGLGALPKLKLDPADHAPPPLKPSRNGGGRCAVQSPTGSWGGALVFGLLALLGLRRRS